MLPVLDLSVNPCFNTQPPEGGWFVASIGFVGQSMFQHTAARRRLVKLLINMNNGLMFQHTAARRRLGLLHLVVVLTLQFQHTAARRRLAILANMILDAIMFQHTAARRRLGENVLYTYDFLLVSTHSRPKAAGFSCCIIQS